MYMLLVVIMLTIDMASVVESFRAIGCIATDN